MNDLTQSEADALFGFAKRPKETKAHKLPLAGGKLTVALESYDRKEEFTLDITRARINFLKGTYQHRARTTTILARLDFGGPGHRNPDDQEIPAPHLHLYREGYGDKWAYPLPSEHFNDASDRWRLLLDFMRLCSITESPMFDRDLFA